MDVRPTNYQIGLALKELILEGGPDGPNGAPSLAAYCDRFGYDRRNLYRYLRGEVEMPFTRLWEHLDNLGVSLDEFMLRVEDTPTSPDD